MYWLVVRPKVHGVKCLIVRGDELMLVWHTYGRPRKWELPGGGIKRGESPTDAARREVREELGVDLSDWRYLGDVLGRVHHKRDTMSCFVTEVDGLEVTPNGAEIAEARWCHRDRLPPKAGRYVALVDRMYRAELAGGAAQSPPTR